MKRKPRVRALYPGRIRSMLTAVQDEPDPPRKFYGFKPREFERTNAPWAGLPADATPPPIDPGPTAGGGGPIDVHDLIRAGAGQGSQLGSNKAANRENEVHGILRDNLARANAAGLNEVSTAVRKFRRRKRDYVVLLIGGNVFIVVLYSVEMLFGFQVQCLVAQMPSEFGHLIRFALQNPASYAMALVGMVFFSGCLTWLMYGVMDDY